MKNSVDTDFAHLIVSMVGVCWQIEGLVYHVIFDHRDGNSREFEASYVGNESLFISL